MLRVARLAALCTASGAVHGVWQQGAAPAAAAAAAAAGPLLSCSRPYSPEPPAATTDASIATASPIGERLAALETTYTHVSKRTDQMEGKLDRIMDGDTPFQKAQAATLESLQGMMERMQAGDTPFQKAQTAKLDSCAADVKVLTLWRTRVVAMSGAAVALVSAAATAACAYVKFFM